ncbi:DNA recombination protein RmuC [Brachybacterium hainanense]|uniref:DNA recombination protein RmuC n=1 Tax=Brachybacterium hainanense TaxID=1541174 RepID=A0ABV6R7R7_9MICO
MDPTLALLIGLLVGLALGVTGAALVQRHRPAAAGDEPRAADQLLDLADERFARDAARRDAADAAREADLQRTLSPIVESLGQLERSLHRTEHARVTADGALQQHLQDLARRAAELGQGTSALTAALRAPTSRGRWGEVQLRRIVEAAGMIEHVDFTEQLAGQRASGDAAQRPDLVVHLSGDRHVVVDAKAPMDAYLDAVEETDPRRAASRRQAHAKALRHHVDVLGKKAYWAGLGDTPEFTVLFVPSDGVLAAALESDPGLLEHAFSRDVVVASPATLVALLRTVAHTWRTDALNRDARAVLDTGRELHHRLGTMTSHLSKLGRSLDASVASFNDTVGSLQSRVLVTARRFEQMKLTAGRIEDVDQLTRRSRTLDEAEIADLAQGTRPTSGQQSEPDAQAG